jgi:hypothetical protein
MFELFFQFNYDVDMMDLSIFIPLRNPFVISPALFWARQVPKTSGIENPSKKKGAGVGPAIHLRTSSPGNRAIRRIGQSG